MAILVACEESQAVTIAFREIGFEAYSADLLPCSGGFPQYHIQGDVLEIIEDSWDMVIAFPPCQHIAVSGAKWFKEKRADGRQQSGIDFFMRFTNLPCKRTAIENPVGIMSTNFRKPNQIIQPYQYGDPYQKKTCLWLKGLPLLKPTNIVDKGEFYTSPKGVKLPKWYSNNTNKKFRSKTFPGIAQAMASQWGKELEK